MRKSTRRIALTLFSFVLVACQVGLSQVSVAAGADVTISSAAGDAQGTSWDVSGGVLTSTTNATINASTISALLQSADLTIDANSLLILDSITASSVSNLTLKATGNIRVVGGVGISTGGGNIIFQSDSDASGSGSTRLGGGVNGASGVGASPNSAADSTVGRINSNGGNIIFSGGTNINTGFAKASSDYGYIGGTKPRAGVAIYGFSVNAGGGNITIRSHGGTIATGARGLMIEQNVTTRASISTTGSGTIEIIGDGSTIAGNSAWGIVFTGVNLSTGSGNISLVGKANTAYLGARGVASSNVNYQSTSGTITLIDETDGSAANYNGTYFGQPNVISTNNAIVVKSDKIQSDPSAKFTLTCSSASFQAYSAPSFTGTPSFGEIDALNCQSLNLGTTNNSSAILISYPIRVGGAINVIGAAIAINNTLTASSDLVITASGNVTETGTVSASGLKLAGSGNFSLNSDSNTVSTVSAGSSGARLASVSYFNSTELTVGTVSGASGIYSSGNISVATKTGNLNITQPVSTTAATGDRILLYANKAQPSGSIGTGNITVSGSGSIGIESGARALLYSGSRPESSGLVNAVGGETNSRSLIDTSTVLSSIAPALGSTGIFALLRTDIPSPASYSPSQLAAAAAAVAEAAAVKREAEKQLARSEISNKFKGTEKVSLDILKQAEIPGITSGNIDAVMAEILALPEVVRTDITQILKVALKYEVVGKIASNQISNIHPGDLVKIGLIPEDNKNKTLLTSALKKLPSIDRSTYSAIKKALDSEMAKIQARKARVAAAIVRRSSRS